MSEWWPGKGKASQGNDEAKKKQQKIKQQQAHISINLDPPLIK